MAEPVIPFAEGSPPDDLRVETLPDGDVLIGDPVLDAIEESDSNFDANLAEDIDEKQSSRKAGTLTGYFENDESARSEWKERYKQGLLTLDPEGGMDENEEERAIRGLSTVVHPLIAEAAPASLLNSSAASGDHGPCGHVQRRARGRRERAQEGCEVHV